MQTLSLRYFVLCVTTALILPLNALSFVAPPPSVKPQLTPASEVVNTADAALLREALEAVDRSDWFEVRRLEPVIRDRTARDILTWYRARRDPAMSFDKIDRALTRLSAWPDIGEIRTRAEESIETSALGMSARVNWFRRHGGATTGSGSLAYATALSQTGENELALEQVRRAWHGRSLSNSETQVVLQRWGSALERADHEKRADFLLWTRQTSAASQMKPYVGADWRLLIDARSRLIRRGRNVDGVIDAVPGYFQSHPGLVFDRAWWRRKARLSQDRIAPLLRDIDGRAVPAAGQGRLWDERNIALRTALRNRHWTLAYDLAARHGMSSGRDFAEAEFNAGWVALRFLSDAPKALEHFENLEKGVSTPISLSRARYWQGRAKEAMGDSVSARERYSAAAEFDFTYYGQLSAQKVTDGKISLANAYAITDEDRLNFQARSTVRAMRLFAENGWDAAFRKFAYHLDDQLTRPQDFELLAELGREYHYIDIGVRGAKAGLARGVVAADAAYPIVEYPLLREPQVERSLMLALSRQESEMNPAAISHANARGLMQFIPRTAQLEARQRGLPYRTSWLTDDPGYNMTLGGAHLDTLLMQFNGSYIMTAAAYNAGASRPNRWIGEYGDPRAGEVDPIDWVELIPFSETRNYVQRVLENTQVYRHRLSGQPAEIRLKEDLDRGRFRE
ncbi:MAG: lytic transglycosylase domain-containing protein [Pseudomonadota bacterium]